RQRVDEGGRRDPRGPQRRQRRLEERPRRARARRRERLEERAQPQEPARALRRPAQRLRRRRLRRHRLHQGRVRLVRREQDEEGGRRVSGYNKDPRDIILAPVVSEKSYGLIDDGKYTFIVDPRSNKTEIKLAIEKIFGVKVASVNTINRVGKKRRTRFGIGKRKDTKR